MLRVVICADASDLKDAIDEYGTDLDISSGSEIKVVTMMFILVNLLSEAEINLEG
jgi:hypothetical protein